MATNIFEDFDEESQNQLAGLKMLDFEQVMGNRQNSSFQSISKNNSFEERSNGYSEKSPFGDGSVFYNTLKGDFYDGYVDFIKVLLRIGAIIPDSYEDIESRGIRLDEVEIVTQVPIKAFNYLEFIDADLRTVNYWEHRENTFLGQAFLNKKIAFLDTEKIFLGTNGSGISRYSLYIPYANDSNVSLNNPNIDYLEQNAAIKLKYLGIDALITIFSFLNESKRFLYLERIYNSIAKEIERTILSDPFALSTISEFPLELLKYFKIKTLETIIFYILRDVVNDDKEAVLLKLFKAFYVNEVFNPDTFLTKLLTEKIDGQIALIKLYDKMNDWGGENNFSKMIFELTKIWMLSSYSDKDNKIYKNYPPTPNLVYNQKIIAGFRNDDLDFEFKENGDIRILESEFGFNIPGLTSYTHHHPFQPVALVELGEKTIEDLVLAEGVPIPAFYLKAFDDKAAWENFEKGLWLIVDIASTFTGIGNLTKLRYLVKASKLMKLKTVFGVIQVASSVTSIGLALIENSNNRELVNKIRSYLFWAEICTLGADELATRILTKQAVEARTVLAEYRTMAKNKKQLGEIDEFGGHLDEIVTKGIFSKIVGKPISSDLLKKLQIEFEKIGGELKFDEESFAYIASREKVMNVKIEAITYNEELILLNKNASTSAVYEELIHAEQFRKGKYNDWANRYGAEAAENLMEKEAAEELLRNASMWKIPNNEIELIKERLEFFKGELKRLKI